MSVASVPDRHIRTELVHRHSAVVRVTHWVNVLCLVVLLLSGLQIFNAHPALYWLNASSFEDPVLSMRPIQQEDGTLRGITEVFDSRFDTTGVLGVSVVDGRSVGRGFPSWLTLPSYQDLASGRRWHFFFGWIFVINGFVYITYSLVSGHWRDLVPTGSQLRGIFAAIREHLFLRFPKGDEARSYNVLQKLAYFGVVVVLIPVLILAGLTMSPGLNAAFRWMVDLFGGRQSARTIHFIAAALILIFVFVHVLMVVLSGVWNNMRSMITGKYRIEREEGSHAPH